MSKISDVKKEKLPEKWSKKINKILVSSDPRPKDIKFNKNFILAGNRIKKVRIPIRKTYWRRFLFKGLLRRITKSKFLKIDCLQNC